MKCCMNTHMPLVSKKYLMHKKDFQTAYQFYHLKRSDGKSVFIKKKHMHRILMHAPEQNY